MKKSNKTTQAYFDKASSGAIKDVYINLEKQVDITGELKEKVLNSLKKSATPQATISSFPYLRKEGLFTGSIVDKHSLDNSDGIVLLIDSPSLSGQFRVGIFYNGFSHSTSDKISIEELSGLFTPGDEIVFRMGTNYRKSKYYVRYIRYKDYELGKETE